MIRNRFLRLKRRTVIVSATLFTAAVFGFGTVWADPLPDFGRPDEQAEEALRTWDPERGLARIQPMLAGGGGNAYLYALHVKLLVHAGRYEEALKSAQEAERLGPEDKRVKGLLVSVQRTLDARKEFRVYRGRRFEVHLADSDRILAETLLEAAEKSHDVLTPFFGLSPGGASPAAPIRIEVYPTAERFHWASGLSRRDIEETGAVGITALNKVMIISPRALTRGYRWVDTLSHEYVHYLLIRATKNNASIWFHEGLAKFLETRWRSPRVDLYLRPLSRTLLAEAVRDNEFVSFKQMEPSLVRLPNPRKVQLAYAEGASAIDFILSRYGREKLVEVFRDLAVSPNRTVAEAMERVFGLSLQAFEEAWKVDLRTKNLKPVKGVWIPSYKVREENTRKEAEEFRAIRSAVARNHLRLGDLLWRRGRQRPAIMEYARAVQESPATPYLRNRLAGRLMAVGRMPTAMDQLQTARRLAPDYGPTLTLLGHLHLRSGRYPEARDAYLESFRINPFDPSIHQGLALAYRKLDEQEKAQAAEENIRLLSGGGSRQLPSEN